MKKVVGIFLVGRLGETSEDMLAVVGSFVAGASWLGKVGEDMLARSLDCCKACWPT